MKQKVGLYFGSFNPIHQGHLIIGNFMIENAGLDEVWFVVSPQNPHKRSRNLLNEYDRLALVEKAIEDNDNFKASNIEFSLPKPSYTIDTLTYLSEQFPQKEFYIIIGGDSYLNIHSWKNADVLLKKYKILVYQRPGYEDYAATEAMEHQSVRFFDAPYINLSASYIREQLKHKKSIKYLLPEQVEEEIRRSGFYQ